MTKGYQYLFDRCMEPGSKIKVCEIGNPEFITPIELAKQFEIPLENTIHSTVGDIKVNINYAEEADWQYYIGRESTNDGTAFFSYELMHEIMNAMLNAQTKYVHAPVITSDCEITYTVGEFVISNIYEHPDFPHPKWKNHSLVLLPVQYTIVPVRKDNYESKINQQ